jgi:uncharacterized protein (DUF1015 family)
MSFCVKPADILLPNQNINYKKFAVIACDQYTSEPEYWKSLSDYIDGEVSSLNLILPEVYLNDLNDSAITSINSLMRKYLDEGVFEEHKDCMVYVERQTPFVAKRRGLVAAIDLEDYSYRQDEKSLIRSSEGTILSRIPPRIKIRENAPIELPHIMLLIDDREKTVIEPLEEEKHGLERLYSADLNMGGGSIKGYKVEDNGAVIERFKALLKPEVLKRKYGSEERLLMAVGDGNHSLATAKTIWENIKKDLPESERRNHPARYALAEIVNIHDEGLTFYPIHRVLFVDDGEKFVKGLKETCLKCDNGGEGAIVFDGKQRKLSLPKNAAEAVALVQSYADNFTAHNGGYTDYIHGSNSVHAIVKKENAVGVLLPSIDKNDFFEYIIKNGALPRKTFSIGQACEKRYYLEARRIK